MQRYFANDEHFKPGGPIFINVGGEWEISQNSVLGGLVYDMAKDTNGYIFATEHRYYGKSIPKVERIAENLKYLSIDQSLADLAFFITSIRTNVPELSNGKFILVGASYAGTMVTWFRLKNPYLLTGSWATSAPLLAEYNYDDYRMMVGKGILHLGGTECYASIQKAFQMMEYLIENKQLGVINEKVNCRSIPKVIETEYDKFRFFGIIVGYFAGLVQYQR